MSIFSFCGFEVSDPLFYEFSMAVFLLYGERFLVLS